MIKFNNYYRNLRQVTPMQRARRMVKGHRNKHHKITKALVTETILSQIKPRKSIQKQLLTKDTAP